MLTKWQGRLYSPEQIKTLEEKAALKQTTDLSECADMFISIAKNCMFLLSPFIFHANAASSLNDRAKNRSG